MSICVMMTGERVLATVRVFPPHNQVLTHPISSRRQVALPVMEMPRGLGEIVLKLDKAFVLIENLNCWCQNECNILLREERNQG